MAAQDAPSQALLESGDAASYGAAGGAGRKMWSWKFGSPFAALSGWSLSAPLVAECFGTGCLVFTVGCLVTGPAPQAWVPTSIAFVLMVMIYATGSISGGNLNPAVSLSLAICGKLPWNKMLTYWMVQLVGGFIGSALFRLVCSPGYVIVAPIKPFGAGSCFCAELIYTTLLCFTVLSCAASRRNNPKDDPNQFYALAIGFTIIAGGHAVGSVSGAALNPAVALSLGSTSGKELHWPWLWSTAELLGGVVAAGFFRLLRREEFAEDATDEGLAKHAAGLGTRCGAELLGAYVLTLTVGLNLVAKSPATAFSAAAALTCMIYSLGNISGAHLNPAVTLAVSLRGKCTAKDAVCYMLCQLFGGLLAGITSAFFQMNSAMAKMSIVLQPGKKYQVGQACAAELLFTMILAYVVLTVATTDTPAEWKTKQNAYFGLAIGACVTVGGFASSAISGGELNPAVSLGIYMGNVVNPGHAGVGLFSNFVLFALSEVLGGAMAAWVFRLTHGGSAAAEAGGAAKADAEAPASTAASKTPAPAAGGDDDEF
mmetsp:Transcript_3554/g.8423  ORF Transcript_3554/g.8423 Transcript_3554/m.8423 type:complete len:541 (-) Transcript_3554:105-1727(-)|eukprot:CAMPEP_0181476708 /NCGR_PEP_ID=MMETSP1110-20121109/41846_1 /TAXON_ID=174948 /ORGANISM="Symbiodinium sp., Strain CCMP421" /LENGTH=540 /DNA_ID=CAMNT_0023601999 /DNA_START=88 /DNA_END=1710 /DNA_ORIENTATION=+